MIDTLAILISSLLALFVAIRAVILETQERSPEEDSEIVTQGSDEG
jgi:hypothetical protein